jgi:uncharacterized protein YeaO (DUF488 family)
VARKVSIRVARAYEPASAEDGYRVLVDRLWPRGLSKDKAKLDEWCKEVAPSTELRRWYGHDPDRFAEFAARYRTELEGPEQQSALAHLRRTAREQPVTLLTGSKEVAISDAAVLAEELEKPAGRRR